MGVNGAGKTCLMRRYFTSTFSETPDELDAEFRKQPGMQEKRYPTSQNAGTNRSSYYPYLLRLPLWLFSGPWGEICCGYSATTLRSLSIGLETACGTLCSLEPIPSRHLQETGTTRA
jgi:GTPase SAR1 family protein